MPRLQDKLHIPIGSCLPSKEYGIGSISQLTSLIGCDGGWAVGEQGIYFLRSAGEKGCRDISFYEFAKGKERTILMIEREIAGGIEISHHDGIRGNDKCG